MRAVSYLALIATVGLASAPGCALLRPGGAPTIPSAPVALVATGSSLTRPDVMQRVQAVLHRVSGRRVLLVDPVEAGRDRRQALAARLTKENHELADYDWREPRCAAETVVLVALETNTDAVYQVSLDVADRTRKLTPVELHTITAGAPGLMVKAVTALGGDEPRLVREESVTGTVGLSVFSRDPAASPLRVERRATHLGAGGPARLLDPADVAAGALRQLPPPRAPEWEAHARRLVTAGCPLLAMAVAEARLGRGPTFRSVRSAALLAMRRTVDRRAAQALARDAAVRGTSETSPSPAERLSCSALCSMHMVELCNNDMELWIEHRVRWEATPCGTRRADAFLEDCYRQQWQSGTFDDACVAPCKKTPEGRERLESILRRAGCLHDRQS